jgi:hypothetical protein
MASEDGAGDKSHVWEARRHETCGQTQQLEFAKQTLRTSIRLQKVNIRIFWRG